MKKIVLTGGGTAGHIYPALALVPYLKDYEIHYIGSDGMEKEILKKHPKIIFYEIPAVKLIRKFTFKNFLIPFKLFASINIARKILRDIKPNIIFSKGGFVSVPVVLAGKWLKIPVVSHESDLSMGLANKIILKRCDVMCTTFFETSKISKKCIFTGQPIRKELLIPTSGDYKQKFEVQKPVLLVIGGSLGASFLNNLVYENIDELTMDFNVIHITGKNDKNNFSHGGYLKINYADDMAKVYASSDIVLSRAGSGVINELLALCKPMLLIPLSKKCSRGDQIENAKLFKKLNYAEVIEEENLTKNKLIKNLKKIIKNKKYYIENMKKADANHACERIIKIISNYSNN